MITKTTGFRASDGALYDKLEDAKRAELKKLLLETDGSSPGMTVDERLDTLVDGILEAANRYIDILTTGPKSRPARRAVNGGTVKRRRPRAATPEQASEGFAAMRAAANGEVGEPAAT